MVDKQKGIHIISKVTSNVREEVKSCQMLMFYIITGGYGSGGGSRGTDELTVMEDTVFVSGMNENATELDIQQHFGSIGIIKVRSVVNTLREQY